MSGEQKPESEETDTIDACGPASLSFCALPLPLLKLFSAYCAVRRFEPTHLFSVLIYPVEFLKSDPSCSDIMMTSRNMR